MCSYTKFEETLLPGNYALTKSMELTKVSNSGTLWYTKKYLVLYYYVFLSKDIFTDEYVQKVIDSFDIYINSLDVSIREKALKYFYPEDDSRNFKSDKFKKFMAFANKGTFANASERTQYYQNAKKCYFALLMGTGGQSGIKKKVVDAIQKDDFHYSPENMQEIIFNAVVDICLESAKNNVEFHRGDVARIISGKAAKEIKELAANRKIDRDKVRDMIEKYPCSPEYPGAYSSTNKLQSPQYSGVESDCFASVRNERQILYYYGYFHSKSSGANDMEASSLTPVGEMALVANAYEFLALWEHQKLKMISQPPTAEINNVPSTVKNTDSFAISYKPYMDILEYLSNNGSMSVDEYKYIVSRRKHILSDEEWDTMEKDLPNKLGSLRQRIEKFGRARDIQDEDGRKELLKYLLGIRKDLPADNGTNPFNLCCMTRNAGVTVDNDRELKTVIRIYRHANEYKIQKYEKLFLECEEDLKRRYLSAINGEELPVGRRTKLHWDLYSIYPDKYVLMCVSVALACVKLGIEDITRASKEQMAGVTAYIKCNESGLLRQIGIKSETALRTEVNRMTASMTSYDYQKYMEVETDNDEVLAQYKEAGAADLMAKIEKFSSLAAAGKVGERTRNTRLVGALKAYYMAVYMENDTLKCESCGNETFITKANEPYLEFYHLIPFNIAYGPDHYLNLFALCPVCHRKLHYLKEEEKGPVYENLDHNNYLHKRLTERLEELNHISLLKTYHLDYLLDDNAISQKEYDELYGKLAA